MSGDEMIYAVENDVATITINRPTRMNALSQAGEIELHRLFDVADADRAVRSIILTGAGDAFCVGADMGQTGMTGRGRLDPAGKTIAEFIEAWHRSDGARAGKWTHMWQLGKPIIAAVNGWALGVGFWYQLAADITIASNRAVFAQPEVRHISNTTYLFTALCGWKTANRWALTGDHFDAAEAYRIGMVNEVVAHEELMDQARALARRIALVPEPSVRLNKAIAMMGMQAAGVNSALLVEGTLSAMVHSSHSEYREKLFTVQRGEGMKAYLDLRDGPFQPEPMGPKSAKARAERATAKARSEAKA